MKVVYSRDKCFSLGVLVSLLWVACSPALQPAAAPAPMAVSTHAPAAPFTTPFPATSLTSPKNSPTPTLTAAPSAQEPGCRKPPDDYTILMLNDGIRLNRRTQAMLQQAAGLYHGEIDILGRSITQGSYHNEPGGFGTHDGGGVLDISVMRPGTYTILYQDIPLLVHALRMAGFAAWLREPDELYDGSPIHIHAVAVGDRTLSPAAQAQVSGPGGYFAGFTGNPAPGKKPAPDRYGGPIICNWMNGIP